MNFPTSPLTHAYPELGTDPIPVEPYTSPDYLRVERDKVFRREWLCVGRQEETANAGDYRVKEIAISGISVIIVRGDDGVIRAFHNACMHRGNRVAKDAGSGTGFSCGFHGWTYSTQGELVYVPGERMYFDLDKKSRGLRPIHCDTWQGFVFINLADQPIRSLAEDFADLTPLVDGYPFNDMVCRGYWCAEVKANWKVTMDAFQEGIHLPYVHRLSITDAYVLDEFPPYISPQIATLFRRHRTMSGPGNPMHKRLPAEDLAFKQGPILNQVRPTPREMAKLPAGINPARMPVWTFDIFVTYPNFRFCPSTGWYFADWYWPIEVDKTLYELKLFMPPPRTPSEEMSQEYTAVYLRDAVREDLSTLETTQASLMSGAVPNLIMGDQEILCRHLQHVVDQAVKAA